MSNFSDNEHNLAELIFQSSEARPLTSIDNESLLTAMEQWRHRIDQTNPEPELMRVAGTSSFVISYDGDATDYWPNEDSNFISEAIIRESLYTNGICEVTDFEPALVHCRYKMLAMLANEKILICPFPTKAGNIAGLLVVCIR